jgi:hypothetical protein
MLKFLTCVVLGSLEILLKIITPLIGILKTAVCNCEELLCEFLYSEGILSNIIYFLLNFSLLVCLTEDGKLLVMCSQTFLSLSLWDEIPLEDFILLEGISAEKETSILLLTQHNGSGKCDLRLASFPGTTRKFFSI